MEKFSTRWGSFLCWPNAGASTKTLSNRTCRWATTDQCPPRCGPKDHRDMEGREAEITFRFSIPPRLLRRVISLIRHGTPTIQLMQNTAQTNFQGGNKMQYDLMKYAEQNARR